jgi:hypothetical protein
LGNYPSQQLVYIYIGINIKIETLVVDCDSENKIKKGVAKRK